MLKRIEIQGFRSLRDVKVEIPPKGLTVLIGPNGSGKTSLLEVLDFVSTAVASRGGLRLALQRDRGGDVFMNWVQPRSIRLAFEFLPEVGSPFDGVGGPVNYSVIFDNIGPGNAPVVRKEVLGVFQKGPGEAPLIVAWRDQTGYRLLRNLPQASEVSAADIDTFASDSLDPSLLLLSEINLPGRYPLLSTVQQSLASMVAYPSFNTTPTWARSPVEQDVNPRSPAYPQPLPRLDKRGTQIINALKTIHDADTNLPWRELFRDFESQFPYCSDFRFPTAEAGGRVGLRWKDARTGQSLTADHLTDGMLAYLQLLAALHAPDRPAAIGFDEPESHLHPRLLRRLVAIIEERAARTPIFVATHSDEILDYLADPGESVATLSFAGTKGTQIQRLDREALETWRESYRPSELRTSGMLDEPSSGWEQEPTSGGKT